MLVTHYDSWLAYLGWASLIVIMYYAKWLILRHVKSTGLAVQFLAVVMIPCVMASWAWSTDWKSPYIARTAKVVGTPIALLTIPFVSFFIDLGRREAGRIGGWLWRVPLEVLVVVPAWCYFWVLVEFGMGWIRI